MTDLNKVFFLLFLEHKLGLVTNGLEMKIKCISEAN